MLLVSSNTHCSVETGAGSLGRTDARLNCGSDLVETFCSHVCKYLKHEWNQTRSILLKQLSVALESRMQNGNKLNSLINICTSADFAGQWKPAHAFSWLRFGFWVDNIGKLRLRHFRA